MQTDSVGATRRPWMTIARATAIAAAVLLVTWFAGPAVATGAAALMTAIAGLVTALSRHEDEATNRR